MRTGSWCYEIWVEEMLDSRWAKWFPDMEIVPANERACPGTVLRGKLPDRAALFGLLGRMRDLNLTIIEVKRLEKMPE